MSQRIDIGKVSLILRGLWDSSQSYEYYDCVKTANGSNYAAIKDVPAGTPLTDTEYWYQLLDGAAIEQAVNANIQAQQALAGIQAAILIAQSKVDTVTAQANIAIEQANANINTMNEIAAAVTAERTAAEQAADRAEEIVNNGGGSGGGENGITPHIGENGNWFIGETDTGVLATGIPAGGTTGQMLVKTGDNDYNVGWRNPTYVGVDPWDIPPETPSAWDDDFVSNTLNSKWQFVNPLSSTMVCENSSLKMTSTPCCDNMQAIVQSAPTGDYTIKGKFSVVGKVVDFFTFGIALYSSSNNKMIITGSCFRFGYMGFHCIRGSTTNVHSDIVEFAYPSIKILTKLVKTGNTVTIYYGNESYDMLQACTFNLLDSEIITHIGVGNFRNNTAENTVLIGKCEYFRVEEA